MTLDETQEEHNVRIQEMDEVTFSQWLTEIAARAPRSSTQRTTLRIENSSLALDSLTTEPDIMETSRVPGVYLPPTGDMVATSVPGIPLMTVAEMIEAAIEGDEDDQSEAPTVDTINWDETEEPVNWLSGQPMQPRQPWQAPPPHPPRSRQPDHPIPWGEDVREHEVTTYGYEAYSQHYYPPPYRDEEEQEEGYDVDDGY